MDFLTAVVASLIAIAVVAVIIFGVRKRKRGGSCSCGSCSGCGASELCHKAKDETDTSQKSE